MVMVEGSMHGKNRSQITGFRRSGCAGEFVVEDGGMSQVMVRGDAVILEESISVFLDY